MEDRRKRYQTPGVIESNEQIVRNESGQARHKRFIGPYSPSKVDRTQKAVKQLHTEDYEQQSFMMKHAELIWVIALWISVITVALTYFFG